jgi:hypothetical protein
MLPMNKTLLCFALVISALTATAFADCPTYNTYSGQAGLVTLAQVTQATQDAQAAHEFRAMSIADRWADRGAGSFSDRWNPSAYGSIERRWESKN